MDMEQKILSGVNEAIGKSILECLTSYNNPLTQMARDVVQNHSAEIKKIMDEALTETIKSRDFTKAVKEVFTHKLARCLMAKMEGEVEKAAHIFRQDETRRAKVIIAIENIIKKHNPD